VTNQLMDGYFIMVIVTMTELMNDF